MFMSKSNNMLSILKAALGAKKVGYENSADSVLTDVGTKLNEIGLISDGLTENFMLSNGGVNLEHTAGDEGYWNTGAGADALLNITKGNNNTAFGARALKANTTAIKNSAFGYGALKEVTGTLNPAVDHEGSYNAAFGHLSLGANTDGDHNAAFGYRSLFANTIGVDNTACGAHALDYNLSGNENNAFGRGALYTNLSGSFNAAFGNNALNRNSVNDSNSAFGHSALYYTVSDRNVGFGYRAGYFNTTGEFITALGERALENITTGSGHIGLGKAAGRYLSDGATVNSGTGDNNLFMGTDTKASAIDSTNEIVIGYGAAGAGSNTVMLGGSSIEKTVLRGNVGIGTINPTHDLELVSTVDGLAAQILNVSQSPAVEATVPTVQIVGKSSNVALRLVNNGSGSPIKLVGLPTSSAGLGAGEVWSNSGVLTVV